MKTRYRRQPGCLMAELLGTLGICLGLTLALVPLGIRWQALAGRLQVQLGARAAGRHLFRPSAAGPVPAPEPCAVQHGPGREAGVRILRHPAENRPGFSRPGPGRLPDPDPGRRLCPLREWGRSLYPGGVPGGSPRTVSAGDLFPLCGTDGIPWGPVSGREASCCWTGCWPVSFWRPVPLILMLGLRTGCAMIRLQRNLETVSREGDGPAGRGGAALWRNRGTDPYPDSGAPASRHGAPDPLLTGPGNPPCTLPGMRKSRGSILGEGLGALVLVTLVLARLLTGLPPAVRALETIWTQGELDRLEQDLQARLESRFLFEVDQVRVFQGDHGIEVRLYGRPDAAWVSWFVMTTGKRPWPTLYTKVWRPRKQNPVSLPPDSRACAGGRVPGQHPGARPAGLGTDPGGPEDRGPESVEGGVPVWPLKGVRGW